MKISHESPICMLQESRLYNDYDYALVHLFETHPEYYEFFKESLRLGRTVYLDNSIFELGEAFDIEKFAEYAKELQSIADEHKNENFYIIIPDVLADAKSTIDSFEKFRDKFGKIAKFIGVVQGKNRKEFMECFWFMRMNADIVAIPFNLDWMQEPTFGLCTKEEEFALGRMHLMHTLSEMGYLGTSGIKVHMLGCYVPQEYRAYKSIPEIVSGDTSNPVVHGIFGVQYGENGVRSKISTKLVDLIDYKKDLNYNIILNNIKKFKEWL